MPIQTIQRYLKRVQNQTGSTVKYMRFALEGNKVERLNNFRAMKNPVLLLYGFGGTRRVLQVLENRLRADGFSVFSLNLGGIFATFNTKPIHQLAELVAKKIETIYQRYQIKGKLHIIGHSKGGLIGRCYIKEFGGSRRVKTLVTLGTAHHGNPWATLGLLTPLGILTDSIRQMTPMSDFIKRMNRIPWPKGVKIVSLYSKADNLCPYPSAVLKSRGVNRIKNIEIEETGHIDFLLEPHVYSLIRQELLGKKVSARRSPLPRRKQKSGLGSKSRVSVKPE